MRAAVRAAVLSLAACVGAAGVLAAPAASEIDAAATNLASTDFDIREQANALLWSAGARAEPALMRAAKSPIPEVSLRAGALLRKIRSGIGPHTPQDVIDLVANYQDGAAGLKLETSRRLLQRGEPAYRPLTHLWNAEKDQSVKNQLTNLLADRAAVYAPVLLADGDVEAAELLLKTAAPGTARGGKDYAAYLVASGKTSDELHAIASKLPASAGGWILLAAGDVAGAARLAEQQADAQIIQTCRWIKGDWGALAKRYDTESRQSKNDALPSLCAAAAFYHLSGDESALKNVLTRLNDYQKRDPSAGFTCAEVFLLSGHVKEGIDILRQRSASTAFDLLCQQFRFDEAFELLKKPGNDSNPAGLFLSAARWRLRLGDAKGALGLMYQAVSRASAEEPPSAALIGEVIELQVQAGKREEAIARALAAGDQEGPVSLVSNLFPSRKAEAQIAWRLLRRLFPLEKPRDCFDRLARLMEQKFEKDELQSLVAEARAAFGSTTETYQKIVLVHAVAKILFAYGQPAQALKMIDMADDDDALADVLLEAGQQAANNAHWREAAELFGRARGERGALAPGTYLQGWAIEKSGDAAEGRRLMTLGRLLPLSDAPARAALADAMDRVGLADAAAAERAVILSMNDFNTYEVGNAARHAAAAAQRRDDPHAAADWLARACLGVYLPQTAFREPAAYFILPRAIADAQARVDLQANRPDGAWRQVLASVELIPSDADWAIQWVLALEKTQPEHADEIFAKVWGAMADVVGKFPDSATYHNGMAWLAARCGRELDRALEHAKKAVALDPDNPALLDTLAETHYRRGEREQAIAAMRECLKSDPESPYYRAQMRRFESSEPVPWQGPAGDR